MTPGRLEEILNDFRGSLLTQIPTDPQLHDPLVSGMMEVTNVIRKFVPNEDALLAWQRTREAFESLIAENPADLMCRNFIAMSLAAEGSLLLQMDRVQEAENRFRRSLDQRRIYEAFAKGKPMRSPSDWIPMEARIGTELDLAETLKLLGKIRRRLRPAGRR